MAQTMSIQPVAWAQYITIQGSNEKEWTEWFRTGTQNEHHINGQYDFDVTRTTYRLAYLFELPSETVSFSDFKVECIIINLTGENTLICEMQKGDNKEAHFLDSQTKIIQRGTAATSFNLSAATVGGGKCVVIFETPLYYGSITCSTISMEFSAASTPSQVYPVNSPTSGTITADGDKTFSVSVYNPTAYPPYSIAAATMYWRMGTSDAFTPVAMTPENDTASATLTAGTITNGILQWYAEATDNNGRTTQTEVYTLTVMAGAVSATALRPAGTVQNAQQEITFEWSYFSLDGSQQARAALEYSVDGGETWITLSGGGGSATSYTTPPGTLPGGTIRWRVKAWSESGDESPWSSPVSFVCLGAPVVLSVTGDGKPMLTVSWQVSDQVSYKLRIDGRVLGPYFGPSTRAYTVAEPLSTGLHKVAVAAQNSYSLWSAWHEADVFVYNDAAEPIQLTAQSGESVRLSWTGGVEVPVIVRQPPEYQAAELGNFGLIVQVLDDTLSGLDYEWQYRTGPAAAWQPAVPPFDYHRVYGDAQKNWLVVPVSASVDGYQFRCRAFTAEAEVWTDIATVGYTEGSTYDSGDRYNRIAPDYGYFLIYRDNAVIAKTFERVYYDRTVLGGHKYRCIQVLRDGIAYNQANQTATAAVDCPSIGLLDGDSFLSLALSEDAQRKQTVTRSAQVVYTYLSGGRWPVAEIGETEDLTVSGDVAWMHEDEAATAQFEAMLKQPVIYKTPGGACVVGVLQGYERTDPLFWKSYRFSIRQMEFEDYRDETS